MKKFLKNNRVFVILVILTIAIYFVRVLNLTVIPVFADEAIYIRWAQVMRAVETLRFLPLSDGKEPLYMWVVIPFFKIFRNPLIAGRVVSILTGFGTMFGIFVLSKLFFKNKYVAIVASFLYAVSPFTLFFDRIGLVDSMLSMFGVWTFIFSYLSITKKRLDFAMLAGFTLGGAWLTKSSALFFAIMLPFFWIFINLEKGTKRNLLILFKSVLLTSVTVAIGYGFYNILRLGPNFHLIASRNMDYVYPVSHIFSNPFDPLKTFVIASFTWIGAMGPWPLLLLAIFGVFRNIKNDWKKVIVLVLWFLAPIIIQSEYAKTFTARYILFSIPFLIIIAASAFENRLVKWQIAAFSSVLILFLGISFVFDYYLITNPYKANLPRVERAGYLEEWTAGRGIKETADYLVSKETKNPNIRIIIGTEGYFGTLPDGLQMYLNNHPEIITIGVGLNFDTLPTQLIESQKAGNDTYLLVNASRFRNSAEKLGIKLVGEFPKAEKPDGTHDSLLLFEVTNKALNVKESSQ